MLQYNPTVSGSLQVTGTIQATQGITGSFSGSVAGFPTDVSAFSASLSTRITATESTSSEYVTTSGSLASRVSLTEATASQYVTASGSLSTRVTATEATASQFITASGSISTRLTTDSTSIASINAKTGSFATTGSNQFNGSQTITGSLTATGTIVAQTLVVQTITSSVDFVTGSARFGSTTGNTHEFTGSVLVSGSITTTNLVVSNAIDTYPEFKTSPSDADVFLGFSNTGDGNNGWSIGRRNTGEFWISNYTGNFNSGTRTEPLKIATTGAATFSSSVTAGAGLASGNALVLSNGTNARQFQLGYSTGAGYNYLQIYDGAAFQPLMLNNTLYLNATGNVGIGTTSPNTAIDTRASSATAYSASNLSAYVGAYFSNQGVGGFANITLNTLDALGGSNCTTAISAVSETSGTRNSAMTFATREHSTGNIVERMRITSGGNVAIGTTTAATPLQVAGAISGGALASGGYPQNARHAKAGSNSVTFTLTVPYITAWYAGHVLIKCSGAQNGLQESYAAMYISTLTYYAGGGVSATVTAIGGSTGNASVSISGTTSSNPQVITITVSDVSATTNTFTADIDATIFGGIISLT